MKERVEARACDIFNATKKPPDMQFYFLVRSQLNGIQKGKLKKNKKAIDINVREKDNNKKINKSHVTPFAKLASRND